MYTGQYMLGLYGDNGKENGNYYHGLYRVEGLGWVNPPASTGYHKGLL